MSCSGISLHVISVEVEAHRNREADAGAWHLRRRRGKRRSTLDHGQSLLIKARGARAPGDLIADHAAASVNGKTQTHSALLPPRPGITWITLGPVELSHESAPPIGRRHGRHCSNTGRGRSRGRDGSCLHAGRSRRCSGLRTNLLFLLGTLDRTRPLDRPFG